MNLGRTLFFFCLCFNLGTQDFINRVPPSLDISLRCMCYVLLHFTLSVSNTFGASLIVSTSDMLVTVIDDLGGLNSSQFRDFPDILTKVKFFTIENLFLPKLGCTWKNVMLSFCPVLGSTMMTFKSLFF